MTTLIINVLAGIVLLLMGRQLFWFFVGTIGFIAGIALATRLLGQQPDWVILVVALIAGIAGALLAVAVQRIAIGLAGFVAGGYGLVWLVSTLDLVGERWLWLAFIVGGIIGVILIAALFDPALIALSSVTGATLIVQAIDPRPIVALTIFLVLLLMGIFIQFKTWSGRPTTFRR